MKTLKQDDQDSAAQSCDAVIPRASSYRQNLCFNPIVLSFSSFGNFRRPPRRAADSLLASVMRPGDTHHDGRDGMVHLADSLPRLPEESEESRGSLPVNPHVAGTCQPCVLFAATVGCHKGERCQYCHMPHAPDARSTTRGVRKHTRDSIKQRVLGLLRPPVDLDAIHLDLQEEADRHPFGRKLITKFLDEPPEEYRHYPHFY
eukprot:s3138_g7.t1